MPAISTCPEHMVELVSVCHACGSSLNERRAVDGCGCGATLEQRVVTAEDTVHDAWLLGRLGLSRRVGHPYLDTIPLDDASELCRVLGCSARGEPAGTGMTVDARRLAETRSLGWRIAQGGETELERALDVIVVRNRTSGNVCNTGYDGLNRFLTLNTDPALDPCAARFCCMRAGMSDWQKVALACSVEPLRMESVSH